ncbi:hypothetical protein BLNAU_16567 [Blattamonas nauphoetae]|uniref:Uncharacterized protein n=1 Tax=Blattamonas nauphoetae TaxID=2049346 RepID=A0ABQ9XB58_9EUKA|nr:hypothetical protein BLNAU_16567 [Blattamonas nauphoetae]
MSSTMYGTINFISFKIEDNCILTSSCEYIRIFDCVSDVAFGEPEMNDAIFERIIVPSEAYIRFFCSHCYIVSRGESAEINLDLFLAMLQMCAYHSSTCTFVVSLPIALTIISLSTFLNPHFVMRLFDELLSILLKWRLYGPHTSKMGKTVIRALNSEGLDDELDQALFTFQPDYIRNMPQKYDYFASRVGSNHVKASPTINANTTLERESLADEYEMMRCEVTDQPACVVSLRRSEDGFAVETQTGRLTCGEKEESEEWRAVC